MGFFKKLWNFVSGKGWQEEEELKKVQEEEYKQTQRDSLREAENLKQEEEIREIPKEEIKEKPKPQIKTTPKQQEEVTQATKRYTQSGSLAKVQERLTEGTIGTIDFTPTSDMGVLKGVYNNLLKKSTISTTDRFGNEDNALIDILIENRNKLQHRFTAEIQIITDGGNGFMSVDGILAEHLNGIYDYLQIGGTYTSQELQTAMQNALSYFEKQFGSIGGNIRPPMNKKVTIQDIQIKMTFA